MECRVSVPGNEPGNGPRGSSKRVRTVPMDRNAAAVKGPAQRTKKFEAADSNIDEFASERCYSTQRKPTLHTKYKGLFDFFSGPKWPGFKPG